MYYYEFKIIYADGKVSYPSVYEFDLSDQIDYCNEGSKAGWIKAFSYEKVKEEW